MQTKLTLRIDDELIFRAKQYSKIRGKSISRIVADYLALVSSDKHDDDDSELTPRVRALLGALSGSESLIDDYHRHLVEKHR